jgi:4-hydroxybenzoyl-CoA reductase subunit beta
VIRLPKFDYYAPRTIAEAADRLAAHPDAMLLAGGTDLLPNMKRRQQTPSVVVGLAGIGELRLRTNGSGHTFGAGLTLSEIVRDAGAARECGALHQAAAQVATPHLRAMGTLGGNLCLDTRCNYYDQSYEWRKAIDFCMKKDGERCWVALSSPTCLAVSSTDTAPALIALRATVALTSASGTRSLPVSDLFANDGMHYLTRRRDEILTRVDVPDQTGWRSTYWKLRRRGSFDFPVLGVAAAVHVASDGTVRDARRPPPARVRQRGGVADRFGMVRRGYRTRGGSGVHACKADGQHRFRARLAQARHARLRDLCPARTARRRHAPHAGEDRAPRA